MHQRILISVFIVVFAVIGCENNDPGEIVSCFEQAGPCMEAPANVCPNAASGSWTSLGLENESVSAIAVHPCNPSIIYAGTQFNFSDGVQGKLFKTTDCGQSWDTLAVGGLYSTIQIDPQNPNVVYAVNGGIMRTVDGGENWQPVDQGIPFSPQELVISLAVNPRNTCQLFAGTSDFGSGALHKSPDAGGSWQPVEGEGLSEGITSIAFDPIRPRNVYVGTFGFGALLKSRDAGKTWKNTNLNDTGASIHSILIHPEHPSILYAGVSDQGLWRSFTGGGEWNNIQLPDSFDNNVLDMEFLNDTILLGGNGILVLQNDGSIISSNQGIEDKFILALGKNPDFPFVFTGLKRLDNLGPNSGGIYIRKY